MSDAVTSQTLLDRTNRLVAKFTNISDGSGESAEKKVDLSTFTGMSATSRCSIRGIKGTTDGMSVRILWDADTDLLAYVLPASGHFDLTFDPPLLNNAGTGVTGDIMFTTNGHTSGDSYCIILDLVKHA